MKQLLRKNVIYTVLCFSLIISMVVLAGCGSGKDKSDLDGDMSSNSSKIRVYTSIYPLEYIAKEVGKEKVSVENIVPVGTESHDFELTGKDVAKIKESDLFVYVGSGMENWGEKLAESIDEDKVIEGSKYVDLLSIDDIDKHEENEEHDGHDNQDEHNHNDGHDHGNTDPHIWLSPKNMIMLSEQVKDRLTKIDSENSAYYLENYEALKSKLEALDNKYRDELKERNKDTFLVSHKAFSYLAKDYGLNQISVTGVAPLAEPSPKTIASLIDVAKKENLKYIYFETLTSPKSVQAIADEAKLESLTLNPLEGLTDEEVENNEDYISIMEKNLDSLKKELIN